MASVKQLRNRIASVKSTQRITSAMKMVAAAKLRRAQSRTETNRPYSQGMYDIVAALAKATQNSGSSSALLSGREREHCRLIIMVSSDRGLCGGFNSSLAKQVHAIHAALKAEGKAMKLITVGRKGSSSMRKVYGKNLVETFDNLSHPIPSIEGAKKVRDRALELFHAGEVDSVMLLYSKFESALTQTPTPLSLIPLQQDDTAQDDRPLTKGTASYDFEPEPEAVLEYLLPQNLSTQIYLGMLESFASEQGARMTAMDNATRNAKELIDNLSITYNRTRQAQITKELIEIISGAEAV